MKKKIILGMVSLAAVAGGVAGLSAFEAHVINVTARIENALQVTPDEIRFGTVFPQEALDRDFHVSLSRSFLNEDRVDDVKYIIRQKPKCGITSQDGEVLDHASTATGHVVVNPDGTVKVECGERPRPLEPEENWGPLPMLCPYLSKHKDPSDIEQGQGEVEVPAFHKPWEVEDGDIVWREAMGMLSKLARDIEDWWVVDLRVPCFGDHCAQDWEEFVHEHNPDADASQYVLDKADEHKVFGCDLWIEVDEVSETSGE